MQTVRRLGQQALVTGSDGFKRLLATINGTEPCCVSWLLPKVRLAQNVPCLPKATEETMKEQL